nr:MAG TPA: hypothetical protein [Caudoviricetes sp.]
MRYFKAFHPGMICNGKQYAENTTYEEQGADECCKAGVMHFCETPFDCLDYYDLVEKNGKIIEFAEVEPLDKILANGNKRATKKLHIGAKLSLKDIINAQVEIQMEKCTPDAIASGYGSKLAASGYGSQLAASGDNSKLAASGYGSQLAASGKDSIVAAIGVNNVASASLGSWIVLAEYGNGGKPICVKAAQVDGETLKANVFYRLKGGEFVEV